MKRPMSGTILYGLLCGALFTPLWWSFSFFLGGHAAFLLTLWLDLAGYVVLLSRWGRVSLALATLPLILCLALAVGNVSLLLFFLAGCLTIGFLHARAARTRAGSLVTDAVLFSVFSGMVLVTAPYTALQWALVIWLFFLVQSVHFLAVPARSGEAPAANPGEDRFRTASRRALEILEKPGI